MGGRVCVCVCVCVFVSLFSRSLNPLLSVVPPTLSSSFLFFSLSSFTLFFSLLFSLYSLYSLLLKPSLSLALFIILIPLPSLTPQTTLTHPHSLSSLLPASTLTLTLSHTPRHLTSTRQGTSLRPDTCFPRQPYSLPLDPLSKELLKRWT
ncbi:MAG: hypothetical protein JOS17DRAFT_757686, partial [Linnemannia elongata]